MIGGVYLIGTVISRAFWVYGLWPTQPALIKSLNCRRIADRNIKTDLRPLDYVEISVEHRLDPRFPPAQFAQCSTRSVPAKYL